MWMSRWTCNFLRVIVPGLSCNVMQLAFAYYQLVLQSVQFLFFPTGLTLLLLFLLARDGCLDTFLTVL
jgi:uncharacterized membrane protein